MKTIAVFFGGQSPEHEISVLTGIQAFHAFDTTKYKPIPIYVTREGFFYTGKHIVETKEYRHIEILLEKSTPVQLQKMKEGVFVTSKKLFGSPNIKIDIAFLAFHGGIGESGSFQGFCETLGLPYTGSGVLGSSVCMDKISMKQLLEKTDIPVSEYFIALENQFISDRSTTIRDIEKELSYPLFVKPSNGGSSIGISRVKNNKELELALELAFSFDSKVLIEKEFEHDTEINISCLGSWNKDIELSITEEVYSDNEFLDFENKYLKGGKSKKISSSSGSKGMASTNRRMPAEVSDALKNKIEVYARKAFQVLSCQGVARIDFLVNKKTDTLVLIEVNTIPGSFAYYLWEATGKPFSQLINDMLSLAEKREDEKRKHTRVFSSSIFKNL
ncbi:MAG: D-alanine--D-alanine ligase [Candidatus Pacebacteria bacterium]|nr:D-alanine--D-alanine ligase [Candidatus Paceibacterota bacterium]